MSARTPGTPYLPWHKVRHPYLIRLRLRLEAMLGSKCAFCGLTRDDGVNLQFHHHAGRDYQPRKLSWGQRLHRYHADIKSGAILALACDQTGNDCHNRCKRMAPSVPVKLYEYDPANQPF
jgi:hypothetical protein